MKVLDLFSGIGGFTLGLERAGHETIAFCEIDKFCQKVLNKWWPSTPVWEDIKTLNTCLKRVLKSSAGASHAKIYQRPEKVPGFPGSVLDSGGKCYEPFAWYDHASQSWKTWQRCFIEGWELYSETWPKAGMTRNGVAYRLVMSGHPISEKESGLLPTLTSQGGGSVRSETRRQNGSQEHMQTTLYHKGFLPTIGANEGRGSSRDIYKGSPNFRGAKMSEGLRTTSQDPIYLNPCFAEVVMGFPLGYTDLEMPSSQPYQESSEKA